MSAHPRLQRFLDEHLPLIEREMYRFLPKQEPATFLYNPMRDYPERGGKRFRPALVLLACEALGADKLKALTTAAAFEILQSFLLIHDDIEDDSEVRRGKPCLHKTYGVPLAINVGDFLHAKVYEVLLTNHSSLGWEITRRLIEEMVQVCEVTCEGQAYDIGWIHEQKVPAVDEFLTMLTKKTGWYSGRGPCRAGGIIAGADEEAIEFIGNFGEAIAVAFQLRDDLLNLTIRSEEANHAPSGMKGRYGKERGGDIAEGKRTLMIIDLFHRCTEDERHEVAAILNRDRRQTTQNEVEKVIALLHRYGSIHYAQEICEAKAEQGLSYLDRLPDSETKMMLYEMAEFLIQRSS
ncbi:MAG: polyprenyl synthetase family protein [Candidatus Latescibacteria bacterium]|nr:polyprenyl synthetase family protein [Candidatus Latescibacterota bacterium]